MVRPKYFEENSMKIKSKSGLYTGMLTDKVKVRILKTEQAQVRFSIPFGIPAYAGRYFNRFFYNQKFLQLQYIFYFALSKPYHQIQVLIFI